MGKRCLLLMLAGLGMLFAESAGGIHWTVPAGWKSQPPRPMRAATYQVGDAECVVYYFGAGQGGGVRANLDRWIGQMDPADGKPVERTETIHGLKVSTLDISGTYAGMAGPMAPATHNPHYRMLGAIIEAPEAPVFFKFTGPAKTVAAHQKEYEALLHSIGK